MKWYSTIWNKNGKNKEIFVYNHMNILENEKQFHKVE